MPAGARGESMGTVSSVMSVAVMVAPLVGAATFGDDPVQAGVFGGELVFVISALLLLLAVLATSAGLKTLVIAAPKVTPIAVLARKAQ
jgi:hypothetical protein